MEHVNRQSRQTADSSLLGYGIGLAAGIGLAVLLVASTIRAIRFPIGAMAESARAIGAGDLDQLVAVGSDDEFGDLATRFSTMARQLRELRESADAKLTLAQQTTQAAIDALPDPVLVVDGQQRVELANRVARRLLGVLPPSADKDNNSASQWQPPPSLRQPLTDALARHRSICPRVLKRPSCCGLATRSAHSCRACCRFATLTAWPSAQRCCCKTSRGSVCSTK